MKKTLKRLLSLLLMLALLSAVPAASAMVQDGLDFIDGVWKYFQNGEFAQGKTGFYGDENGEFWFIRDGVVDFVYHGLVMDESGNWWLVENGKINFRYNGLFEDPVFGWCLIAGGAWVGDYSRLYGDPVYGWWLVEGGKVNFAYTGLYGDPVCGWWLVENGKVIFDRTGLYPDEKFGTWLLSGGAVAFGYTGFWDDPDRGRCLVVDGAFCKDYTGLSGNGDQGWFFLQDGVVDFGFSGLYGDQQFGWWLVQNGAVAFEYSGLYYDPSYGWWLIENGNVSFGYTGLYNDENHGWWFIQDGQIAWDFTGSVDGAVVVGGRVESWENPEEPQPEEPDHPLKEVVSSVETHTKNLDSSFTVDAGEAGIDALLKSSAVNSEDLQLTELLGEQGISSEAFSVSPGENTVTVADAKYYAGWRILQLWKQGKTDQLTDREKQALQEALKLVQGATGSDLEKERYIYDALTKRVSYYDGDGDPAGEKDCAVGALLNGRADCDGYADVLLLCCGLAGIEGRYVHGNSLEAIATGAPDSTHKWNLLFINGEWVNCDLTWGDYGDGMDAGYLYFNIGNDLAQEAYRWNTDLQTTPVATTANTASLLEDQQPETVSTQEDVYNAVKKAYKMKRKRVALVAKDDVLWETDPETFADMVFRGGIVSYKWKRSGKRIELTNLKRTDEELTFCDTEEEIIAAVNEAVDLKKSVFAMRLTPVLAKATFTNGHAKLNQILKNTNLKNPGAYSYVEETGTVILENVE